MSLSVRPARATRPRDAPAGTRLPTFASVGTAAWYLVGMAACVLLVAYGLGRIRLLVLAFFAALALTTVLSPVVRWLERRHVPTLLATWFAFLVFAGALGSMTATAASLATDELRGLDTVAAAGVDDVEAWLVDGPLSLDPKDVATVRTRLGQELLDLAGGAGVASGARAVGEAVTGVVLALALAFFLVKDGPVLERRLLGAIPHRHRPVVAAAGAAAWRTLIAYVRGMALIGLIEGVAMTVALTLVGADLAVPIGILTAACAFLPFVGAVVAGVLAVLVALVSGGAGDAAVIAVFALVLQQFDNELLAPVVYGRMTRLHPVVVLAAVAGGAGLAGLAGAVLAVPLVATIVAATAAARRAIDEPVPSIKP